MDSRDELLENGPVHPEILFQVDREIRLHQLGFFRIELRRIERGVRGERAVCERKVSTRAHVARCFLRKSLRERRQIRRRDFQMSLRRGLFEISEFFRERHLCVERDFVPCIEVIQHLHSRAPAPGVDLHGRLSKRLFVESDAFEMRFDLARPLPRLLQRAVKFQREPSKAAVHRHWQTDIFPDRLQGQARRLRMNIEVIARIQIRDFASERSRRAKNHPIQAECHFVPVEFGYIQMEPFQSHVRPERKVAQHKIPIPKCRAGREVVSLHEAWDIELFDVERPRFFRIEMEMKPRQFRIPAGCPHGEIQIGEVDALRKKQRNFSARRRRRRFTWRNLRRIHHHQHIAQIHVLQKSGQSLPDQPHETVTQFQPTDFQAFHRAGTGGARVQIRHLQSREDGSADLKIHAEILLPGQSLREILHGVKNERPVKNRRDDDKPEHHPCAAPYPAPPR